MYLKRPGASAGYPPGFAIVNWETALFVDDDGIDATGPLRTSVSPSIAALQLHQTGHSCIAQHFRRASDGSAGPCGRSLRLQHRLT